MSGDEGWGDRSAGGIPSGRHDLAGYGTPRHVHRGSRFLALTRSWVTGGLVHLALGFVMSRVLVDLLATEERLESFGWRLALLHLPALVVTLLTVLASARTLPEEYRESSRVLYLLAALAVPLAGMLYGFAVAGDVVGIEGVLMPGVSLAAGAASGVAVDRLLEERATRTPEPPRYTYDWRDGGATAVEYPGLVALVALLTLLIGAMATAGVGGETGERPRCAISSPAGGGGGSCLTGDQDDTPTVGTPVTGVLVAGVDSQGVPFVVRLNAVNDTVDAEDLDAFVESITIK